MVDVKSNEPPSQTSDKLELAETLAGKAFTTTPLVAVASVHPAKETEYVITVVPAATGVITPPELMVATPAIELDQDPPLPEELNVVVDPPTHKFWVPPDILPAFAGAFTVIVLPKSSEPLSVVTVKVPVFPEPTVAVIEVGELLVTVAATPPMVTEGLAKSVPVIVISPPSHTVVEETFVIVGGVAAAGSS